MPDVRAGTRPEAAPVHRGACGAIGPPRLALRSRPCLFVPAPGGLEPAGGNAAAAAASAAAAAAT